MKHLTDEQLEVSFKKLVAAEREILHQALLHIREVDRRRLYLKKRSNLFEYLTLDMGYSKNSAQRRIDAARLVRDVPEVLEKIRDGKINLSDVTLLQKGVRQKESTENVKVAPELKREILQKMEVERESEKVVAQSLDLPVLIKTKVHVQKDESVRLEITLSKEDAENLRRCQELHGGSAAEIFGKLMKAYLAKKDPLKKPPAKVSTTVVPCEASNEQKYMSVSKRRFVFQRDRVCQHRDERGKVCGSQYRLEVDHVKPLSLGGTDDVNNLRLLCSNHNKYMAMLILGEEVMRPYLKK